MNLGCYLFFGKSYCVNPTRSPVITKYSKVSNAIHWLLATFELHTFYLQGRSLSLVTKVVQLCTGYFNNNISPPDNIFRLENPANYSTNQTQGFQN